MAIRIRLFLCYLRKCFYNRCFVKINYQIIIYLFKHLKYKIVVTIFLTVFYFVLLSFDKFYR